MLTLRWISTPKSLKSRRSALPRSHRTAPKEILFAKDLSFPSVAPVRPPARITHTAYTTCHIMALPWTYSSSADGILTLRSTACVKTCSNGRSSCRACGDLANEPTLQGILNRAKDGIHESANYAYHPISGLITLLRR